MSGQNINDGFTYRGAGVDISAGNRTVALIKELVKSTRRSEVLGELGSFSGLCEVPGGYREPVLVSGTDGVGTKLKIAGLLNRHDSIGIDLVAMCVNDILVHGAEPLFFLDYFACGHLDPEQVAEVISGIAAGCRQAGCALLGGETAEMPGFYGPGEYDLAGFAVGVAEKKALVDGGKIKPGDRVIGLASSGLHSNGYSLARRVLLEYAGFKLEENPSGLEKSLGEELLTPTRIYVPAILNLYRRRLIKGMAHITGGGLLENLPRTLPPGTTAVLDEKSWPDLPIFKLLAETGNIARKEMYRTFNMGIGFVLVVDAGYITEVIDLLDQYGEKAFLIGKIETGKPGVRLTGDEGE